MEFTDSDAPLLYDVHDFALMWKRSKWGEIPPVCDERSGNKQADTRTVFADTAWCLAFPLPALSEIPCEEMLMRILIYFDSLHRMPAMSILVFAVNFAVAYLARQQ